MNSRYVVDIRIPYIPSGLTYSKYNMEIITLWNVHTANLATWNLLKLHYLKVKPISDIKHI